ncbi:MAG: PQQ-dependent sugar dehydrogenase [Ardenticatenaceae bacterium]
MEKKGFWVVLGWGLLFVGAILLFANLFELWVFSESAIPAVEGGAVPRVEEAGFVMSVVANSAQKPFAMPTSLTWGADGAMYVSSMEGDIIRVTPDGRRVIFAEGFDVPLGLAFRPTSGALYVSHRGGVSKVEDRDGDGVAEVQEPLLTGMYCCYANLHQTNGIQFGPDGWLYIAQGSSSDHGDQPIGEWEASILRVHPDEGQESLQYVATGLRNPYDLVVTSDGQLFATDNAADYGPPEELNHIIPGKQYGWPHCITNELGKVDTHPAWNDPALCEKSQPAIATFNPHLSPTGITAYEADQFPAQYQGNLFLTLWNRLPQGHRLLRVQLTPHGDTFTTTTTPFITDLHQPVDVAVGPDGALYIVEWQPGRIYKVTYRP